MPGSYALQNQGVMFIEGPTVLQTMNPIKLLVVLFYKLGKTLLSRKHTTQNTTEDYQDLFASLVIPNTTSCMIMPNGQNLLQMHRASRSSHRIYVICKKDGEMIRSSCLIKLALNSLEAFNV